MDDGLLKRIMPVWRRYKVHVLARLLEEGQHLNDRVSYLQAQNFSRSHGHGRLGRAHGIGAISLDVGVIAPVAQQTPQLHHTGSQMVHVGIVGLAANGAIRR